jgi:hypothetical protein
VITTLGPPGQIARHLGPGIILAGVVFGREIQVEIVEQR